MLRMGPSYLWSSVAMDAWMTGCRINHEFHEGTNATNSEQKKRSFIPFDAFVSQLQKGLSQSCQGRKEGNLMK
jgi:hypothetical protein